MQINKNLFKLKKQNLLILVTNDDGINAKGIRILIEVAKLYGEVLVVAPDSHQSAKSHSITQNIPISFKKIKSEENYAEYSCSGTPVDCVKIAIHEIAKRKPDLILSGINHGLNTSISVIYSGTMAAAIEGSFHSISSAGFSGRNYLPDANFSYTIPYIKKIIEDLIKNGLPEGVSLNVNFPNNPKAMKVCRASAGKWQEKFVNSNNPFGKKAFWISGKFIDKEPDAKDTDIFALKQNYISIVPTKVNFNDLDFLKELEKRKIYKN